MAEEALANPVVAEVRGVEQKGMPEDPQPLAGAASDLSSAGAEVADEESGSRSDSGAGEEPTPVLSAKPRAAKRKPAESDAVAADAPPRATIAVGGRQYTVQPDSVIELNRLHLAEGEVFEAQALWVRVGEQQRFGTPFVPGALVRGRVEAHLRGKKVIIFKFKRRKNYHRKRGHRQELTQVRVETIELGG